MAHSTGLKSVGVSVPDRVLTNDHWRRNHPQLIANVESRTWMWRKPMEWTEGSEAFNLEMAPYVRDPFRGARQRRTIESDGSALELELTAAWDALKAAAMAPEDIDLLICTAFQPDTYGVGSAAALADNLGIRCAAWNLESACSSALVAFQTACSLVESGQHRNVLVVSSCTYSRTTEESDPISWGVGDAASAFIVGPVENGAGYLGGYTVHSAETCDAVAYHPELDSKGKPRLRLRTSKYTAEILRGTSERYLQECCHGALSAAGVSLADIDHFVFNTPLAWYSAFCARVLGVDRRRTLSVYPLYANVGPALLGMNLLHAAHWKQYRPGELVLLYTVGSVSTCSAAVMRWGDVALGSLPDGVSPELLEAFEAEAGQPASVARVA
ncbi:MAG: 3-oxoacyl-[acyl-carrier-protein] synthase III C-terminal domain-containing protein [Acidobacteriota bacterium]